ncbi:MAG: (d)CMP kinase [Bacilli bacterium]|nr:(d)CMP kinase [Bacilli bacterium]
MKWQIAIDGPSGAGKSTIAKLLANKLGIEYLDTGAMYRACTVKALRLGINLEDEEQYRFLEDTSIEFRNHEIYLDGENVAEAIRTLEVTKNVSMVCHFGYVREKMVELQRKMGESISIIMDGRDIGTVVLPNANLKIFLTADLAERAKRRMLEREEKGQNVQTLEETMDEMATRDYKDSHREIAPLCKAEDAIEIDTTNLSISEVVEKITSLVNERGFKMEENKNVEMSVAEEQVEAAQEEKVEEVTKQEVSAQPAEESTEVAAENEEASVSSEEEAETQEENSVKPLQLVKVVVLEVLPASKEVKKGDKVVRPAKEERVLVQLENGQEGLLFRNDLVDINEDEELVDQFMEGDELEAIVKKVFPDGGKVLLSQTLLEKRESLKKFEEAVANHEVLKAKVVKAIQVGLVLDHEGYTCLLPSTQITDKDADLASFVKQEIEVVPIRVDYNHIRLIVSQTVADAIKNKQEKNDFISSIKEGDVFDGTVKNITSYGAFVELGHGVEGLLHISEIDHNRVNKVEKVLNTGDAVKVQVIKVDTHRINLSRKALIPNYWKDFIDSCEVGATVKGIASDINNAGVVVDLNEHVQGFLPKSEVSWEKDANIEDLVTKGSEIEAKVIELDLNKKRIILSLKQLVANPWEEANFVIGATVTGTIVKILPEGFKVNVNGLSGYLPKGNVPKDTVLLEGQEVTGKVRAFEPERTRLIITLREDVEKATPKADKKEFGKYMKNDKVTNTFGDFLNLDDYKNLK